MALIDQKGRIFGKINIIDFAIFIFLIIIFIVSVKFIKGGEETWIPFQIELKNSQRILPKILL